MKKVAVAVKACTGPPGQRSTKTKVR